MSKICYVYIDITEGVVICFLSDTTLRDTTGFASYTLHTLNMRKYGQYKINVNIYITKYMRLFTWYLINTIYSIK